VVAHFGLAFLRDVQFEVIQPVAQETGFYAQALPEGEFAVRLHHLGRYYAEAQAYAEAVARARRRWPIPVEVALGDGGYAYADARPEFGHYLEMFTFQERSFLARIPHY
jgi:hypothetical protein